MRFWVGIGDRKKRSPSVHLELQTHTFAMAGDQPASEHVLSRLTKLVVTRIMQEQEKLMLRIPPPERPLGQACPFQLLPLNLAAKADPPKACAVRLRHPEF